MDPLSRLLVSIQGHTFRAYLESLRNADITIVSAFGVTETTLLESLVHQNKKTTFYVGTQNCFTRPDFIEEGERIARAAPKRLQFVVDFRRNESIHYKLALVAPSTVVIGSANFTSKGLGLTCDIMAVLDDSSLYAAITSELRRVARNPGVFATSDELFTETLRHYEKAANEHAAFALAAHATRSLSNPFATKRTRLPSFTEWLASDDAVSIKAFAYLRDLEGEELIAADEVGKTAKASGTSISSLFPYAPERKPFVGIFLDIDGTTPKPSIHVARSFFYERSRNCWIMLGKHLTADAIGFRMSSKEARRLTTYALKNPGLRTLSVPEMRKALESDVYTGNSN